MDTFSCASCMKMKKRTPTTIANIEPQLDNSTNSTQEKENCLHFKEFSSNTSIHGIRYIGDENRHIFERIWWLVMFTISLIVCAYLISKVWDKWMFSPVIVSFNEKSTPIWEIPFPAITICPLTKSRQSVFNYTQIINKQDENVTNEEKVAPQLSEVLMMCKLFKFHIPCTNLFKPILTEEGVCFTFNMLDSNFFDIDMNLKDYINNENNSVNPNMWDMESGYKKEAPINVKPVRTYGNGDKLGVFLLLRTYSYDLDYVCGDVLQGYKIMLHHPADSPRIGLPYFYVPLEQAAFVVVKPDMMTTSDTLKGYTPKQRQCFFPHERKLRYHSVYTQINCQLECTINETINKCGCASFYMPGNNSTPICSPQKIYCVEKAEMLAIVKESITSSEICNCLPACTSLQYNTEMSQANFDWSAAGIAHGKTEELSQMKLSTINIFFKERQFITSRRSELYGLTDFLANCGGLLGLCMGFSILSLIEIIYFMSIKPLYHNIQMNSRSK